MFHLIQRKIYSENFLNEIHYFKSTFFLEIMNFEVVQRHGTKIFFIKLNFLPFLNNQDLLGRPLGGLCPRGLSSTCGRTAAIISGDKLNHCRQETGDSNSNKALLEKNDQISFFHIILRPDEKKTSFFYLLALNNNITLLCSTKIDKWCRMLM